MPYRGPHILRAPPLPASHMRWIEAVASCVVAYRKNCNVRRDYLRLQAWCCPASAAAITHLRHATRYTNPYQRQRIADRRDPCTDSLAVCVSKVHAARGGSTVYRWSRWNCSPVYRARSKAHPVGESLKRTALAGVMMTNSGTMWSPESFDWQVAQIISCICPDIYIYIYIYIAGAACCLVGLECACPKLC